MLATKMDSPSPKRLFSEKIYWLHQLRGELPETTLITDFTRPQNGAVRNQSVTFELEAPVSQAVLRLGQGSAVSVYVFLLSVVSLLLTRYTRRHDWVLGVPAYFPEGADEEANAGANAALPLRGQIATDASFKQVLLQTKATLIDTYVHQTYPLESLYSQLGLQDGHRHPLFD
ncbi:MAG: non-ribosomal peptide synthetase, partial [Leptolyngbya sp. SIO4C5]|nr:non-ribosomal peptide synthetase [Leptolyngbya sp. SIO4C5]